MEHRFWIATAYKTVFTKDDIDKLFSVLPEGVEVAGSEEGLDFFCTRTIGEDEMVLVKVPQYDRECNELKCKIRSLKETLNAKNIGRTYSDSLNIRLEQEIDILQEQLEKWPHTEVKVINHIKATIKDEENRNIYQQKVDEVGFGNY